MKRFKNINDEFQYGSINFVSTENNVDYFQLKEILNLDFDKFEFFFQIKYEYSGSCFQCKKLDSNISTLKISEFDENEHVRDGNYNMYDFDKEFDETSEIFDSESFTIWLYKINSTDLKSNLLEKVKEFEEIYELEYNKFFERCFGLSKELYQKKHGDIPKLRPQMFFNLSHFLEWIGYSSQSGLDDIFDYIIKIFGKDKTDLEEIFDELDIDTDGNLVKWYSYYQLEYMYFSIGYRVL